jgi:type II secretory ATPase GspE/PulE/Tfp pilus assembly ATPase PilB-like protein
MEIEQYALKNGMIDLERDGIFKVMKWATDLEEVYRYVKMKHN